MNREAEEVSIVFIGSFNPAIFHPDWLLRNKLINQDDHEYAIKELKVVHKFASGFPIRSGLGLVVDPDRFQLHGDFTDNHKMRDLAINIFRLLEHCPVTAMGVNRLMHFRLASKDELVQAANRLSGVDRFKSVFDDPWLRSYEVIGKRPDGDDGYLHVKIAPSSKIVPGLLIHVNNHRERQSPERLNLEELLKTLDGSWDQMMNYAIEIADKIWGISS